MYDSEFEHKNQPYVAKFEATKFMLNMIDELTLKGYKER